MSPTYITHAQYLGHDAALAAASWVIIQSDSDAESLLSDNLQARCDVRSEHPAPSLHAGEEYNIDTLAEDVFGPNHTAPDAAVSDVTDAWQDAAYDAFNRALRGVALRHLGRIEEALEVERELDQEADVLKRKAGL